MKIWKLNTIKEYEDFVKELAEQDQPVYVYRHSLTPHLVLVHNKEVIDPDEEIDNLEPEDDLTSEDDPLWDDGEDIEEEDFLL